LPTSKNRTKHLIKYGGPHQEQVCVCLSVCLPFRYCCTRTTLQGHWTNSLTRILVTLSLQIFFSTCRWQTKACATKSSIYCWTAGSTLSYTIKYFFKNHFVGNFRQDTNRQKSVFRPRSPEVFKVISFFFPGCYSCLHPR
jgi:hypothetical protein